MNDELAQSPEALDAERAVSTLRIYYGIHALLLIAFPLVIDKLSAGGRFFSIVALGILLIATHAMRSAHFDNWIGTHYRWLLRTQWLALAILLALIFAVRIFRIGPTLPWLIALAGVLGYSFWVGYRYFKGWRALNAGTEMAPIPRSTDEVHTAIDQGQAIMSNETQNATPDRRPPGIWKCAFFFLLIGPPLGTGVFVLLNFLQKGIG